MALARPWLLLLFLLFPCWWWWQQRRRIRAAAVVGDLGPFSGAPPGRWRRWIPPALRALAVSACFIAATGPHAPGDRTLVETDGISIVLVIDISSSMLDEDRLAIAKARAIEFVRGRRADRIGLVIFAGEALTMVPATLDYGVLINAIEGLQVMQLGQDGTAIGSGLATAVSRLRRMPGKERVIILLTDGENNRGLIDPRTAAQAAQAFGIRVYTVGVASSVLPPTGGSRSGLDEELLGEIATSTGGQYFRADGPAVLADIFERIDALERTPLESIRYIRHRERTTPFVLLALGALLLELVVSRVWVVRLP